MLEPKDEIRQKLDVADVVGGYIQLKPAGSGSFKGVCPFHAERTPSFHVSRERQIWHCFGCDKGGDIFAFVMELEGMTFPEALKHLASRAGVALPEYKPQPKEVVDAKESLLSIHVLAQKFYATVLRDHPDAAEARAYLADRGITQDLVDKFGLGYAPDRWDTLVQFLGSRGIARDRVVDSGLGLKKKSGDGLVDRFRHRIMIPLTDPVGNIVGFTARIMKTQGTTTTPDAPKYMNSPESAIYHKGEMLYGLSLAKTGIRSAKCVIVVEGNLDVIASHKAGVENIVASSGTALTEMQLRMLQRYTKRIVFALDEDAAGFAAAKRVLDIARTKFPELDVRCLIIPKEMGKDPDDVVQKNPEAWQHIASSSKEIIEFMFDRQLKMYEVGEGSANVEDRRKLIGELVDELVRMPRAVDRHLYMLRLSDATHVSVPVLEELVTKSKTDAPKTPSASAPSRQPISPPEKHDKSTVATRFIIGLLCADASIAHELAQRVPPDAIPDDALRRLYIAALTIYNAPQNEAATAQSLFSRFREQLHTTGDVDGLQALERAALFVEEQVATLSAENIRAELDLHIAILDRATRDTQRRKLEAAIRDAELSGASDTLRILLAEYAQLLGKKHSGA